MGAGKKHWAGWLNVDAFRGLDGSDLVADVRALPLETGMASRVVAIHLLEHLYRWEAEAVLTEWTRILEPGGQLILELPCMDKVFQYIRTLPEGRAPVRFQMTSWAFWGDPSYEDPSMTHKWGYFRAELMQIMTQVGLEQVQEEPTRYHLKQRDMRITGRKPLLGQRKDHV